MVTKHYREIVNKLWRGGTDYDNITLLLDMVEHIMIDCPDHEFCTKHITSRIEKEWLRWAQLQKDPRMFECAERAYKFDAQYSVDAFFTYIEMEDQRKFYEPRRDYLSPIVQSYQDLYDGKLDLLCISQPKRTGKALPVNTMIVTPTGVKRIGDVRKGDMVIGLDGKPTAVKGVYFQGKKRVFYVHFKDVGDGGIITVKCCEDHLWTVRDLEDRKNGSSKVLSTKQIAGMIPYRLSVDYCGPVQYEYKRVPLDPYLYGILLASDIDLPNGKIHIHNRGSAIRKLMIGKLAELGVHYDGIGEGYMHFSKMDRLISAFKAAGEYRIGADYLINIAGVREQLIHGFCDASGSKGKTKTYCSVYVKSYDIASGMEEAVRSLGGRSFIHPVANQWSVTISFKNGSFSPFSDLRRISLHKENGGRFYHYISGVEDAGFDTDMVCIEVESPDHQYLIHNGFIPTHNTSSALRLVAMMSGRNPAYGTLATGRGESLVGVFYSGINQIFDKPEFLQVFPWAKKVKTNADKMEVDLEQRHMFATVQCRPIDGAIVGSTEAHNLLYIDDAVQGHDEAMNRNRLDSLRDKILGDVLGRRLEGTPILIQGTRYSIYDPIGVILEKARQLGWRYRELAIPALDPLTDESNFECIIDGKRQFTTEYYRNERKIVTPEQWGAEFQQEPFEAKGLMFPEDQLNRYTELPPDKDPDTVLAACDTATTGADSLVLIVAYLYGSQVFVEDVVWDNSPTKVTIPECAQMLYKHKVVQCQFESNSAGEVLADDVARELKELGGRCTITKKRSIQNKMTRIEASSKGIIENFYFKSQIKVGSQYYGYFRELVTLPRSGKVPHDDAPDCTSLLEGFIRELVGTKVEIIPRDLLGF